MRALDDAERIEAAGVTEVRSFLPGSSKLPIFPETGDEPALISFTSGTEGKPKAVLISAAALANTVDRLIEVSGIEGEVCEYVGVPVYHSFGFGRCRVLAKIGGTARLAENGFDPEELAALLSAGEVDAFSAVPSQLRMLLKRKAAFEGCGSRVRFIEIGSQFMAAEEKEAVRSLFPNASITQHYGLTEASRSTFLRIDKAGEAVLGSVGKPQAGTDVRICKGGRIELHGPHLATGLLVGEEIVPLADEKGWLRTSDLGRIEEGYLYFEGRADDLINCGGKKVSPEAVEARLASEYGLSGGFALGRLPDPVYGEGILLVREEKGPPLPELLTATQHVLTEEGLAASGVLRTAETDELPRTPTGKIRRRELASLAAPAPLEADPIAAILGNDYEETGLSASEAEIDSLQTLNLAMLIEERVGSLPPDWRSRPVSALLEGSATAAADSEPINDGADNRNPQDISFWALVREDLDTNDGSLRSYGFWALFWHRFGNWRMSMKTKIFRVPLTLIYLVMNVMVNVICGIKLDYTVNVGRRVKIEHFGGMMLGARRIGNDVTIRQNTTFGVGRLSDLKGKPIIEDGVNLGAGVVVAGRVRIGRHSVIGPNCVVMEDIPPYSHVEPPKPTVSRLNPA
nr:AMP-binding protein [Parvularcula maris]